MNNQIFTIDDIKPGYLVVTRNGDEFIVTEGEYSPGKTSLIMVDETGWYIVLNDNYINTHLSICSEYAIEKIYGLSSVFGDALKFSIKNRRLLWENPKVKKMTKEDIEKALGYPIEIVEV